MRAFLIAAVVASATVGAAQPPRDQFFDSKGVRIRYVEQGSGDPVLLIHGYTRNIETNWMENGVFQDLAKDHRVIAFDLRGHGKSGKPYDPAAYGAETAQDAIRLLDHLGIKRTHVVGYSLGAALTLTLLTTDPDRFITATLGAHGGYRTWRPEYAQNAERAALELESDVPFRSLVVAMTPRDEPRRTEEEIRERSTALAAINDVKALAAYTRSGTRELSLTDSAIASIKVPTLGITGTLDNVASMQRLQTTLPAMRLVIVEGATHSGDRATPRRSEFIVAIREFIAARRN